MAAAGFGSCRLNASELDNRGETVDGEIVALLLLTRGLPSLSRLPVVFATAVGENVARAAAAVSD